MSVGTWTRVTGRENLTSSGNATIVTIPAGSTLLRVHAGLDVQTRYWTPDDPNKALEFWTGVGLYTRNTSGGTVLTPLTNPTDEGPPTQRWLYWRVLTQWPMPPGVPGQGGYQMWGSSYVPWNIDVQAPVKANSVELTLSIAWEANTAVPSGGASFLAWWAAALVS